MIFTKFMTIKPISSSNLFSKFCGFQGKRRPSNKNLSHRKCSLECSWTKCCEILSKYGFNFKKVIKCEIHFVEYCQISKFLLRLPTNIMGLPWIQLKAVSETNRRTQSKQSKVGSLLSSFS